MKPILKIVSAASLWLFLTGALLLAFRGLDLWMGTIVFEVRLRRSEFYAGEPMVATVVWRNESRFSLGVEYWAIDTDILGYYWGAEVERDLEMFVEFEGGERLESHGRQVDILVLGQDPLPPGREIQRAVRLERGFDLSRAGHYKLQVTYEPWFGEGNDKPWFVEKLLAKRFRSVAEADFEVMPWGEGSPSDAYARAEAGDPGAVHLLGLHGAGDSVHLLSRCLEFENRELRYEAAHALGRIGNSAAIRVLGDAAVKELDRTLKSEMVRVLIHLDSSETFPWLKTMLEDTVVVSEYQLGETRIRSFSLRANILSYLQLRGEDVEAVHEEVISGPERGGRH